MKKILTVLGLAAFSFGYSQGGTFILNNYSQYDYEGYIIANNIAGSCYPYITSANPELVKVPANSHMGNGNELRYDNYRDQFNSSPYPMASWNISTSSTSSVTRPWNHPSLMQGGVFSLNTRWATIKFAMFYPGTHINAPDQFGTSVTIAANSCYSAPDYYSTPSGSNSAEIFTITNGTIVYTYAQLY